MGNASEWQAPVLGEDGKAQREVSPPLTISGLVRDAAANADAGKGSRLFVTEHEPSDEGIPAAPPGVSVDANLRRARELQGVLAKPWPNDMPMPDPAFGIMTAWFPSGHEMDYKKGGSQYRDFGNFNYGAVGSTLGFDPSMLHGAAGVAQMMDKKWKPGYGLPFFSKQSGDNEQDYEQIDRGIAYERSHKPR